MKRLFCFITLALSISSLISCGGSSPIPSPGEQYKITWKNDDGSILKEDIYERKGLMPEYATGVPTKKSSAQYSYTFSYWEPSLAPVTCDATYTAKYESHLRSYEIEWQDDEGHTLRKETLKYGEMPNYGSTPTKESAQYIYTFTGWSPSVTAVTGPAIYKATFSTTIRKHAITWKNDDDTTLRTDYVEYGKTPSYGSTPSKSSTDDYDYEFDYWSPSVAKVTGPTTYTAHFKSFRKYLITWKNYDNSILKEERLREGKIPSYSGVTPTKPSTAQYTYSFSGWNPSITTATCDKTYTAQFSSITRSYEIVWENDDGTILKRETLTYDSYPSYGSIPTKLSTDDYDYEFAGWSPSVTTVTGPTIYRATYSSFRKYLITWKNYDNSILKEERLREGKIPSYSGVTPTKPGSDEHHESRFTGWSPSISEVTEPTTYKATFETIGKKYTITWKMDNGAILKTDQVEFDKMPEYGATPTKASTIEYDYTFSGWSPSVSAVTGPTTYTAQFSPTIRSYNIVFKNGDKVLQSERLEYGTTPTYKGDTPTKEPTAQHEYTFSGWTPEIAKVTGEATYTAEFSEFPRKYTLTVTSEHTSEGTVTGSGLYVRGSNVTIAAAPSTGYVFEGWYENDLKISSEASYTFAMPVKDVTYTAKFLNENTWYIKSDWWNYCSNGVAGEQATEEDVGKEVDLTVNNQIHKVRLIGIDHDDLVGGGKAHCTFEFSNLLSDSNGYSLATFWNTSGGSSSYNSDYLNSNLRKALDGQGNGTLRWYQKESATKSTTYTTSVIDMLPIELKNNIKTAKKYVLINTSGAGTYYVTNYNANVFALTYDEMTNASGKEGTTYQYYKDHYGNLIRSKYQIKWHDGAATNATKTSGSYDAWIYAGYNGSTGTDGGYYWLASPSTNDHFNAWYVNVGGVLSNYYYYHVYNHAFAVAPAFCI